MTQDTTTPFLRVERQGAIALITMDRPATRNALDGEDCYGGFETVLAALDADLTVAAIVLTGAGTAFCSGGNVAQMRDRTGMFAGSPEQIAANYKAGIQRIPLAFEKLEVPVIAAVNGPAMGAGNDLACMCDVRVASTAARFAESFVQVGIIPGDGGAWWLPRLVGHAQASLMAFTGDALSAEEALRIGLVQQVVPPEELLPTALALAGRMARHSPQVLRWTKRLMRQGRTATLAQALDQAGALQGLAHHEPAHMAAVEAFFTKRPAKS